jgi:type III pantothenate kinase
MLKGVADIGNTRIKAAVFDSAGAITHSETFTQPLEAAAWFTENGVSRLMVSSVGKLTLPSMDNVELFTLTNTTKIPFSNQYKTPETLGVDRIAAMAAACMRFPGKPVLVFDIGTCMTIDMMHPDKTYKGGNISPGLEMRLKAMQTMTSKLPYAPVSEAREQPGNTTLSALANGALWGMKYEIEGYIAHFESLYPDLVVVLCGGDISHFDKQLKYKIFAAPDFVLQGLYELLLFNEK